MKGISDDNNWSLVVIGRLLGNQTSDYPDTKAALSKKRLISGRD